MASYSTATGENNSTVSMNAGTSLFRKLVSVGSGFTVTGIDFWISYGGVASAAFTGLSTTVPNPDIDLKWALSYGPSTFTPPALLANEDDTSLLWFLPGETEAQFIFVPSATAEQTQYSWRLEKNLRYQFRLAAASDFCLQVGNNSAAALKFDFLATARVSYA